MSTDTEKREISLDEIHDTLTDVYQKIAWLISNDRNGVMLHNHRRDYLFALSDIEKDIRTSLGIVEVSKLNKQKAGTEDD